MQEAEDNYYKEHEEEMEAFKKWEEAQKKANDEEYATEEEEEEKDEEKEPPKKPNFETEDRKTNEDKFDEDHEPITIPAEIPEEFDNDWVMSEEELTALVDQYWESKQ